MATLYQSNGIWNVKYWWGDKRYSRSLKTKNRDEARRAMVALESELAKMKVEVVAEAVQGHFGTVSELVDRYVKHVEDYHRPGRVDTILRVLAAAKKHFGSVLPKEFGPKRLKALREVWVDAGLKRQTCNEYTGIVKAMFGWGVEEEFISETTFRALQCVKGLRAGHTLAPESEARQIVPREDIFAVADILPQTLRAMILLQFWTGARPGEIFGLTPGDIDSSKDIWVARIVKHKNAWRENGKPRFLAIPTQGQELLRELLLETEGDEPLFQPVRAMRERWAACETHRKVQAEGTCQGINDCYNKDSYRLAITRACKQAGVAHWTPYQLRHTAATEIEEESGAQAARAVLGHSSLNTTQIYLHADMEAAIEAARNRR